MPIGPIMLASATPTFVFVYGTLKTGLGNHWLMEELIASHHASFVSTATTKLRYPLVCGPYRVPFLLNFPSRGHQVEGELYSVDESALERLDELEGVSKFHYERQKVDLIVTDDLFDVDVVGTTGLVTAQAYFACSSYAHRLLNAPHVRCYGAQESAGYVPRKNRPEGVTFLEHVQAWISDNGCC